MSQNSIQIQIELEDVPKKGFEPGGTVSGKVIFTTTKECETNGIALRFVGSATAEWNESKKRFHNSETYFEMEKNFLEDDETNLVLPSGESSFPFSFDLPEKPLPANYSGPNGKVEYNLVASFRTTSNAEVSFLKRVWIHSPLDLRIEPGAAMSSNQSTSRSSGLLCCSDGPVTLKASLRQSGFVPGEKIPIDIEVQNHGKRNVEDVSYEIVETASYISGTKNSRTEKSILYDMKGHPIARGETDNWRATITVPKLPPTRLGGGCSIIDVEYMIKIETHSKKGQNKIKLYFPIIIGTIPIR